MGLTDNCGTKIYMAPELIIKEKRKQSYDSKVDIWALGITMFMLLGGKEPYKVMSNNKVRPIRTM